MLDVDDARDLLPEDRPDIYVFSEGAFEKLSSVDGIDEILDTMNTLLCGRPYEVHKTPELALERVRHLQESTSGPIAFIVE